MYNMKQKITQMRLARYLFTAMLPLLFISCSKGRSSEEPQPNNDGYPNSSKHIKEEIVWDEISSEDYKLSADGLTLVQWLDKTIKNLDMNRDPHLMKVKIIGPRALSICRSLTNVNIPNSVTSIGEGAFSSCDSLKSVNIPNSVTSIGEGAFSSCDELTSITIPSSVTSIGESVCDFCRCLTSIHIPSSVTSIGKYALRECHRLTSITIPSSVTSIGEEAFRGCRGLTRVVFKGNNPPKIAYKVFEDTPSSFKLIVPKGAKSAYIKAGYPEDKLIEE